MIWRNSCPMEVSTTAVSGLSREYGSEVAQHARKDIPETSKHWIIRNQQRGYPGVDSSECAVIELSLHHGYLVSVISFQCPDYDGTLRGIISQEHRAVMEVPVLVCVWRQVVAGRSPGGNRSGWRPK